jgi:hypothetical protein
VIDAELAPGALDGRLPVVLGTLDAAGAPQGETRVITTVEEATALLAGSPTDPRELLEKYALALELNLVCTAENGERFENGIVCGSTASIRSLESVVRSALRGPWALVDPDQIDRVTLLLRAIDALEVTYSWPDPDYEAAGVPVAGDGDGVYYLQDNCPTIANPDQSTAFRDSVGDACLLGGPRPGRAAHLVAGRRHGGDRLERSGMPRPGARRGTVRRRGGDLRHGRRQPGLWLDADRPPRGGEPGRPVGGVQPPGGRRVGRWESKQRRDRVLSGSCVDRERIRHALAARPTGHFECRCRTGIREIPCRHDGLGATVQQDGHCPSCVSRAGGVWWVYPSGTQDATARGIRGSTTRRSSAEPSTDHGGIGRRPTEAMHASGRDRSTAYGSHASVRGGIGPGKWQRKSGLPRTTVSLR